MVAELLGIGAVVSMRLKIRHGKVDRASQWGGEREILGKGEPTGKKGRRRKKVGCQHTIAGKVPKIQSGG